MITIAIILIVCGGIIAFLARKLQLATAKATQLEGILDAIPLIISATDKNRNWIFVNKAVTSQFGKSRSEFIGKQCSQWGADICKSDQCGINCLSAGKDTTTYQDLQVKVGYIYNPSGQKVGHVEVVQDVAAVNQRLQESEQALVSMSQFTPILQSLDKLVDELNNGADSLNDTSDDQVHIIDSFTHVLENLASTFDESIAQINQANKVSISAKDKVSIGRDHMQNMMVTMTEINQSSVSISEIIKIIESIASQTNLLALNAAIESARAGEAGRGFAVVANEIRDLANKTSEIVKEVEENIKKTLEIVDRGQNIANNTDQAINGIVETIEETAVMNEALLSTSSKQQDSVNELRAAKNRLLTNNNVSVAKVKESVEISDVIAEKVEELTKTISK